MSDTTNLKHVKTFFFQGIKTAMNGLQATADSRGDRNNFSHCKSECSNSVCLYFIVIIWATFRIARRSAMKLFS